MTNKVGGKMAAVRAGNFEVKTRVTLKSMAALAVFDDLAALAALRKTNVEVDYQGFSPDAQKVFQRAVDIWSVSVASSVPVRIHAAWTPLGANVLGQAGPSEFFADTSGVAKAATYYPSALACKLAKADLASAGDPHIEAQFNSNFTNWYFGLDGNTPGDSYDLLSVVLHELGHGLGFIGSMDGSGAEGSYGLGPDSWPAIYDHFVFNQSGQALLDAALFPNPSTALKGQLTSAQIFFQGTNAVAANQDKPVRLYAPSTWEAGSSYSHLDETTFSASSPNTLMTPLLGRGQSIHSPGPIGLGILQDLGW